MVLTGDRTWLATYSPTFSPCPGAIFERYPDYHLYAPPTRVRVVHEDRPEGMPFVYGLQVTPATR